MQINIGVHHSQLIKLDVLINQLFVFILSIFLFIMIVFSAWIFLLFHHLYNIVLIIINSDVSIILIYEYFLILGEEYIALFYGVT